MSIIELCRSGAVCARHHRANEDAAACSLQRVVRVRSATRTCASSGKLQTATDDAAVEYATTGTSPFQSGESAYQDRERRTLVGALISIRPKIDTGRKMVSLAVQDNGARFCSGGSLKKELDAGDRRISRAFLLAGADRRNSVTDHAGVRVRLFGRPALPGSRHFQAHITLGSARVHCPFAMMFRLERLGTRLSI